jgi:hypothetical protein
LLVLQFGFQSLPATQSVFPDRSSFRFGMRCD